LSTSCATEPRASAMTFSRTFLLPQPLPSSLFIRMSGLRRRSATAVVTS
jgi:hypothetical protein